MSRFRPNQIATLLAACMLALCFSGCMKPYEVPEYIDIDTSETAFMVPLEDSTGKQTKLDSAEAYAALQVSAKRVLIPKRWNKTGRLPNSGEWIPTVRVIKVDRAPVTRQWTADPNSGTSNKDEAIWAESQDSVGFSTGFNVTAHITEPDAARFLYWYPNGSLANVMDFEIRSRIQQVVAEVSSRYNMDKLRERKQEIIDEVRKDIIPFYAERGISITTVGMFGGFLYENPKIQESIDLVFVAQQEKAREAALLEAMDAKKKRLQEDGIAQANMEREVARGKADAILLGKTAEADGIRLLNDALQEAQENPLFVKIKALEVESERIKKWDGSVPRMIMGEGQGFVPVLQFSE